MSFSSENLFFKKKIFPGETRMSYNPLVHHRRSIRLRGYDYTQAGMYYITLCVKNREPLLGEIVGTTMRLSRIGEIAEDCWKQIPEHFSRAVLDKFVIMPDHMHGVIVLVNPVGTRHAVSRQASQLESRQKKTEQFSRPVSGSLSTIVRSFKSAATKRAHEEGYYAFDWQSRFYEHIIRDGEDLDRIREYIADNVKAWADRRGGQLTLKAAGARRIPGLKCSGELIKSDQRRVLFCQAKLFASILDYAFIAYKMYPNQTSRAIECLDKSLFRLISSRSAYF